MYCMRRYLYPLLLILAALPFVWYDGYYYFQNERKSFVQEITRNHIALYESIFEALQPLADTIYQFEIDRPEILEILDKASKADEKELERLHWKLYHQLIGIYDYLLRLDIRQLHFHLPGAVSFLRFHRPEKFGDSLRGIRPSIEIVNRTHRIVRCFEEGRIFNGFRNVYPLIFHKKFVGTVEISFDAAAIIKRMVALKPHDMIFLINRSLVSRKVWASERKNYVLTPLSDRFLADVQVMRKFPPHIIDSHTFNRLMKKLRTEVTKPMQKGISFSKAVMVEGKSYLATFINIRNCRNQSAAYLVSLEKRPFIDHLLHRRWVHFGIGSLLILAIALLLYFYLYRLEKYQNELEKEAIVDRLTGCYNRHGYDRFIPMITAEAKRKDEPLCILFCDIDHFKVVNDTYGHKTGDEVLRKVTAHIRTHIRKNDLCIRWGGEEFIIFTLGIGCNNAKILAEKLRKEIATMPLPKVGHITVSFGVTCLKEGETLDQMITRADDALYEAKEKGRNRVVVRCPSEVEESEGAEKKEK